MNIAEFPRYAFTTSVNSVFLGLLEDIVNSILVLVKARAISRSNGSFQTGWFVVRNQRLALYHHLETNALRSPPQSSRLSQEKGQTQCKPFTPVIFAARPRATGGPAAPRADLDNLARQLGPRKYQCKKRMELIQGVQPGRPSPFPQSAKQ
jgi:hypothetical protein